MYVYPWGQVGMKMKKSKKLGRRPARLQISLDKRVKSDAFLINLGLLKMFWASWDGGRDIIYKEHRSSPQFFFLIASFRLGAVWIPHHVPRAVSACVPWWDDHKIQRHWGLFHEMGRNLKHSGGIIHPHTSEALCNLWSVYVRETVLDIPGNQAHSRLSPQNREQRIDPLSPMPHT